MRIIRTVRSAFSESRLADDRREPYGQVFILAFLVMLATMLPVMIFTGGYFIYYGDFNSQQLPFYTLAHRAVQDGAFGWNWETDLGANFIGSYSFYLLGSPFFWITTLFPNDWVVFLMPYLLALKHAVAALTAYAYIRRFVRSHRAAMVGGLLYAFSGFQLFNIFFNHFQDVTAFFPLLLIALEERVNENRRGVFALTVALMAMLNYFFFTGEVVFVLLYFIVRCPCKDFHIDLRKFFSIALESIIGVMISCVLLLPSALAILENNRVDTHLTGQDMVAYYDKTRILRIIQSFFMIPDVPARPNLFDTDYGKWASIGGYLPLFSMAGVIAFMSSKRKHWATRLTAICIFCACIPIFNTMFYAFNSSYYARWYFMPILIMALMTAYALDNRTISWKGGIITCGLVLAFCGMVALFPKKNEDGETVYFSFPEYPEYFWLVLILCVLMLGACCYLIRCRNRGKAFFTWSVWGTVLASFVCTCTTVYFGISRGAYPTYYVNYAINGGDDITLEEEENQFFRIDISEDYDNYPMFWGYSNMRCFHSVVPPSIMEFYQKLNITRDVASRVDTKHYPLRAMFNVKYYFDKAYTDKADTYDYTLDMPGFTYIGKQNSFYVYENEAYLPMGIAYDQYIDEPDCDQLTDMGKEKSMIQALCMDLSQILKYQDILTELPAEDRYAMDEAAYVAYCKERRADTCDSFTYDSYGFTATIALDKPKLVFFSVPAEDGWTATVNGKPVDIERVNYCFMAVRCEKGDNVIEFHYETPGLAYGFRITLCGIGLLIIYLVWTHIRYGKQRPAYAAKRRCYDYDSVEPLRIQTLYARYAAAQYQSAESEEPDTAPASEAPPDSTDETEKE